MLHSQIGLRRSDRRDVDLSVEFQMPWGRIRRVSLTDISVTGCRVCVQDHLLDVGDAVLIRTSALSGASGTVKWCRRGEAGIEFFSPLEESLFAQFSAIGAGEAKMIVSSQPIRGMAFA